LFSKVMPITWLATTGVRRDKSGLPFCTSPS
jgi:hypothetical protein